MTNLVDAFKGKLESHGGTVRLGNGVKQILVEDPDGNVVEVFQPA